VCTNKQLNVCDLAAHHLFAELREGTQHTLCLTDLDVRDQDRLRDGHVYLDLLALVFTRAWRRGEYRYPVPSK
jgi:hypothetical protein